MTTPNKHILSNSWQSGIKKTHLTPCRRIGLSRVIRSSNTSKLHVESVSHIERVHKSLIRCHEEPNTLPVKVSEPVLSSNVVKNNDERESAAKLKDNSLSTLKQSEFNKKNSVEKPKPACEKENTLQNKANKNEIIEVTNSKVVASKAEVTVNLTDKKIGELKKKDRKAKESNKSDKTVSKTLKKRLSMKKSANNSENSEEDFSINLSELDDLVDSNNQILFDDEIKFKPKKRRTVVCVSDDEEDNIFMVSQNSFDKKKTLSDEIQEENWNDRIKETRERIKKKEFQLKNLKQAAIYKKLHNLNELKNLTDLWRNGFEEAVRCLLVSLQEHGPMSMTNLLKNLNIPPEFIRYDENDDKFV